MKFHLIPTPAIAPKGVVVYFHAWLCDSRVWHNFFLPFQLYHQVLVDLPGHGHNLQQSVNEYQTFKDQLLSFLQKEFSDLPVTFIGWSVGGIIARDIMQDWHNPQGKLILLASAAKLTCEAGDEAASLRFADYQNLLSLFEHNWLQGVKAYTQLLEPISPLHMAIFLQSEINLITATETLEFIRQLEGKTEDLKQLKCPTLLVASQIDKIFSVEASVYMYQHLQNSQMYLVQDFGHAFIFNDYSVLKLIKAFIDQPYTDKTYEF